MIRALAVTSLEHSPRLKPTQLQSLRSLGGSDLDPDVRGAVFRCLAVHKDLSPDSVDLLIRVLADADPLIQQRALMAIALYGSAGETTFREPVQKLVQSPPEGWTKDIGEANLSNAFTTLARITKTEAPSLVELLRGFLQDDRRAIFAIRALGIIGVQAKPALPDLQQIGEDPSASIVKRRAAKKSIEEISSKR